MSSQYWTRYASDGIYLDGNNSTTHIESCRFNSSNFSNNSVGITFTYGSPRFKGNFKTRLCVRLWRVFANLGWWFLSHCDYE